MPLVLGLASSHAPSMFAPAEKWQAIYDFLAADVPQPPQAERETPEVIRGYIDRIQTGFQTLRKQLETVKPDALIIVGDDQNEVFGPAFNASLAVFTGAAVTGTLNVAFLGEPLAENHVALRCNRDLARALLKGLVEHGFDPAWMDELVPLSRPTAGIGHAFSRPAQAVGAIGLDIPIIPLFLNAYHPPLPSARRCYALGQAIQDTFASRPERVAIYASGGLSHDPRGPRAGWVDEPLDRWVLDRLQAGDGESLANLYTFDSDTMRSGTGEIRAWITVAGACEGQPATVVDYIPARQSVTGLGFAYWPERSATHAA